MVLGIMPTVVLGQKASECRPRTRHRRWLAPCRGDDVMSAMAGGDRRRMGGPSAIGRQGSSGGKKKRGDRATAPIENIWCEKMRGCSCRGRRNVRYAPIASSERFAAK